MLYDSLLLFLRFLPSPRAAFALEAAFFDPLDAACLGGMFNFVSDRDETMPTDRSKSLLYQRSVPVGPSTELPLALAALCVIGPNGSQLGALLV